MRQVFGMQTATVVGRGQLTPGALATRGPCQTPWALRPGGRLLAGAALVAVLAGCTRPDETRVLRMGHSLDPSHPVHAAMEQMAAEVQARSEGRLQIKIYPSSLLGSEREMIELLQLGAIDLIKTSTSPLEGFVPGMAVFGIPYVFRDAAHYWKVLDGPVGRQMLDLGLDQRLKGLCYYDAGSRSFYTRDRAIRTPADLRGLKIRVQNSRMAIRMIEAMGGAATPIAFGELYSALDQGVVDGAENNPPSLLTSRHYEVCKFYSLNEHTRVPDIVIISTESWARLTPEQRVWLQDAADASSHFQRALWTRNTQETLDRLSAAGVQIIQPDLRAFQESVRPLHDAFGGTELGRWLKLILEQP
jgi:tripartite ATP-independent transporter DctP family solute receptor